MIYVVTHKVFDDMCVDRSKYKIIHVGENQNCKPEYIRDDTGTNISARNPSYCELTALYWIWKNAGEKSEDISGLLHYRRYFTSRWADFKYKYFNIMPPLLSTEIVEKELLRYDILLPKRIFIVRTIAQFYADFHSKEDLLCTRKVLEELHPEYISTFDKIMSSHRFIYGNMFLCRKEVLDRYAAWVFPILFNLERHIDIESYEHSYQKRVYGFLSERLLQVWIIHNGLKYKEYPVFNTEQRTSNFLDINKERVINTVRRAGERSKLIH